MTQAESVTPGPRSLDEWEKLQAMTAEALRTMLIDESEAIANDIVELGAISSRMVGYWRRSLDGDETASRLMRHLRAQARLLVEIHHVESQRNLVAKVERILAVGAQVGLALLRAGLRPPV